MPLYPPLRWVAHISLAFSDEGKCNKSANFFLFFSFNVARPARKLPSSALDLALLLPPLHPPLASFCVL